VARSRGQASRLTPRDRQGARAGSAATRGSAYNTKTYRPARLGRYAFKASSRTKARGKRASGVSRIGVVTGAFEPSEIEGGSRSQARPVAPDASGLREGARRRAGLTSAPGSRSERRHEERPAEPALPLSLARSIALLHLTFERTSSDFSPVFARTSLRRAAYVLTFHAQPVRTGARPRTTPTSPGFRHPPSTPWELHGGFDQTRRGRSSSS